MRLGGVGRLVVFAVPAMLALSCRSSDGLGGPGGASSTATGGGAAASGGTAGHAAAGARGTAAGGFAGGVTGAGAGGAVGVGGAGGAGVQTVTKVVGAKSKIDLLFMIDDSASMAPLQAKMQAQLPAFLDALVDGATRQLPDLHVAVVSSSFGGGAWTSVNQCHSFVADPNTLGDDAGRFLQGAVGPNPSPCTMLHPGTKFLANVLDPKTMEANYDGDIRDAFKCIALLGDKGCGFESQFESVYYALYKASLPDDPDNGGFLRTDATLAIVMVTNEDDCSVRGDSLLLSPAVNSVSDPTGLGALQSYRCNEFGHLCDGVPPPHDPPPSNGVTLKNCVSAENNGKTDDLVRDPNGKPDPTRGHLWPTVADFSTYVKAFKRNPDDVLVAAIAGPTVDATGNSLYRVIPQVDSAAMNELVPMVDHSCTQQTSSGADPEYADPAVRIRQWVDTFGANGVFYPICANDFKTAMVTIATKIQAKAGAFCASTNIALDPSDPTKHACRLIQTTIDPNGTQTAQALPECDTANSNAPCFMLVSGSVQCISPPSKTLVTVCATPTCVAPPASGGVLTLSCATNP